MKTANELSKMKKAAEEEEAAFWTAAAESLTALIAEKGKVDDDGVPTVYADDVFGDECRILRTEHIENDGMSGSGDSEHAWEFEEASVVDGAPVIQCEGYEFDPEDFRKGEIVRLVQKLEKYDSKA